MKQIKNQNSIDVVKSFINTPFFFKGRSYGGIDCAGLYEKVIQNLKNPKYKVSDYTLSPSISFIETELSMYCEEVATILHGDILLLKLPYNTIANHIAFFAEENSIIHTYVRAGKVQEVPFSNFWKDRVYKIYRIK